ncbi:MAG: hypothetical protein KME20_01095 [Kaiparowitsia implicata GSE-PSE-MK54-09C]|jgi:hypothetical protein|nr:hypothetical protein [Kaiparowitsia implicata GSE-PSE-MK54-09C]
MSLRIVSEQLQTSAASNVPPDGYFERLRKYIPAEVVGFWLTVSGMIQSAAENIPKAGLLWFLFVVGLFFTYAWTRRQTQEPGKLTARTQIAISCGAFIVWVFATGGPFAASWEGYEPLYGSLLLVTYTLAVAFVIPPEK